MEPSTIALFIGFATKYGIPATLQLIELYKKKTATVEDVKAAFAVAHKTYEEYEALPPGSTVPQLPS